MTKSVIRVTILDNFSFVTDTIVIELTIESVPCGKEVHFPQNKSSFVLVA